ncbi:MAG: DNA polymerase I, partial [Clostridiales bacterium]|nr:DNA polymerase I [Clostridiales bacterium]
FKEYKGTRKGMPDELVEQIPLMKEVFNAMGVTIIEKAGYEADDILGTLATRAEKEGIAVSLVSGDRDLLQLASDNIKIRIPKTKRTGTEIEDYYAKDVLDKYQVTPKEFIDLKGLMGDQSDNIPGVPGVGEKTGTKLIVQYHSIENLYDHVEELKPGKVTSSIIENKEIAFLSKKLATIETDCQLDLDISKSTIDNLFNEDVYLLFKRLEFKNLIQRFQTEDINIETGIEEGFKTVTSLESAEKVFAEMKNIDKRVGFHLITEDGKIIGLSICNSENKIYLIKVSDKISGEYLTNQIMELVDKVKGISVIGLKQVLPYLSFTAKDRVFDCAIAAYLINPLTDTYHYDDIARDYMNMTIPSVKDLFGKISLSQSMEENDSGFLSYSCYSAYVAYKSPENLIKRLKDEGMYSLFEEVDMPLAYTLYDMEYRGIRVNKEELKEYGDKLGIGIEALEKSIYEQVGETFNINSPKQLGVILFEKLRLPFAKKTKTGYSTAADILEKLQSEHPVVKMVLEYRTLSKLKSTYADGLAVYIQDDERIHGKFNQTIAATGRISSTDPNLQNIPIRMELGRQIRKVFIPKEDYVFLDADYSQIELRVLAHMSKDETLINAYKESKDIHQITASQVFHTPFDEVTSLQRSNAKAVNFGIVYGISSFGLGQDLNISRKEAEGYINKYFETYPKIKTYLDQLVIDAKENGYSETLFGRRRPIPELSSSNFMQRSFGERIAMNSPIQGTAADIIKIAMIKVNEELKEKGLRSRLLLQIHDELLVETHKDEIKEVSQIMINQMVNAAELLVPLEVEVKEGHNWYEAK